MPHVARIFGLLLALAATACASDYVSYTPSKSLGGDVCDASATPFACEGDTLKICGSDGIWAKESCDSVCAGQGLTYDGACDETSSHGHPFCRCKAGCCTDGERLCADDGHLTVCASCATSAIVCDDYCTGLGLKSEGCAPDRLSGVPSCGCRGIEGGVCPADFNKCQEGWLSICDSFDKRPVQSCREQCTAQNLYFGGCTLDAKTPKETCECTTSNEPRACRNFSPSCVPNNKDNLTVCTRAAGVTIASCSKLCAASGLVSLGCVTDADRGHDVCQCAVQTN